MKHVLALTNLPKHALPAEGTHYCGPLALGRLLDLGPIHWPSGKRRVGPENQTETPPPARCWGRCSTLPFREHQRDGNATNAQQAPQAPVVVVLEAFVKTVEPLLHGLRLWPG